MIDFSLSLDSCDDTPRSEANKQAFDLRTEIFRALGDAVLLFGRERVHMRPELWAWATWRDAILTAEGRNPSGRRDEEGWTWI
jgi:hypothetical protein